MALIGKSLGAPGRDAIGSELRNQLCLLRTVETEGKERPDLNGFAIDGASRLPP